MDYILQIEKLISYLKFNYTQESYLKINAIKRKFNSDFNLLGCFIKDYLILKTNKKIEDESIYEEFVLYFEKNIESKKLLLDDLNTFCEYYLMIVFEECENVEILSAISTINLCFCMQAYPLIMQILDDYYTNKYNGNITVDLLQCLVSIVLERFENQMDFDIDFQEELRKRCWDSVRLAKGIAI